MTILQVKIPSAQAFTAHTKGVKNPLESLKSDTSCTSRQHLSVRTSAEEKCPQLKTSEDVEQDVEA